jgi:hypothetical protein
MEQLLNQIVEVIDSVREDAAKFEEKGNGAAGKQCKRLKLWLKM